MKACKALLRKAIKVYLRFTSNTGGSSSASSLLPNASIVFSAPSTQALQKSDLIHLNRHLSTVHHITDLNSVEH